MNLYVGNLSPETTEDNLRKAFTEFGAIASVKILIDPNTGLPRGFGFVEMVDRNASFDAMLNLDGSYLDGTIISVKEAKQKDDAGGGGRRPAFRSGPPRERTYNNNNRERNFNSGNRDGGYNRDSREGGYNSNNNDNSFNNNRY